MGLKLTGERAVRRLAAILAADVVGYSRLMGREENGNAWGAPLRRTPDQERLFVALRGAGLPD